MASRHVATAMAALNLAATPPHLRAAQGAAISARPAPAPAAGAAPKGAAPRAAVSEFVDWDVIVAAENARIGVGRPQAAPSIASPTHQAPATPGASYSSEAIDWSATVAAVNAENNCTRAGPNPDPQLVAMLSREAAR